MTRTARALRLALLFNVALATGVLAYGVGGVPIDELSEILNWFGLGTILSVMALSFTYMAGMEIPGKVLDLGNAPLRGSDMRMAIGIFGCGALAVVVLGKGTIETVLLLAS